MARREWENSLSTASSRSTRVPAYPAATLVAAALATAGLAEAELVVARHAPPGQTLGARMIMEAVEQGGGHRRRRGGDAGGGDTGGGGLGGGGAGGDGKRTPRSNLRDTHDHGGGGARGGERKIEAATVAAALVAAALAAASLAEAKIVWRDRW